MIEIEGLHQVILKSIVQEKYGGNVKRGMNGVHLFLIEVEEMDVHIARARECWWDLMI